MTWRGSDAGELQEESPHRLQVIMGVGIGLLDHLYAGSAQVGKQLDRTPRSQHPRDVAVAERVAHDFAGTEAVLFAPLHDSLMSGELHHAVRQVVEVPA